jgi:hypothetical protein
LHEERGDDGDDDESAPHLLGQKSLASSRREGMLARVK